MSFIRRGLAPFLAVMALAAPAAAGDLDDCLNEVKRPVSTSMLIANPDLGTDAETLGIAGDDVLMSDAALIGDFHPETDRWTPRTNRIKTSLLAGGWAFSGEMDIDPTFMAGVRISWEVPGFIAIRWDSSIAPFAQLEVKSGVGPGRLDDDIDGFVHSHILSLGIFNPELSISNLAFWAGFGGGLFFFNFNEDNVFVNGDEYSYDGSSEEENFNITGHIFAELDYKVIDILHIGLGFRYHVLLASQTDVGRFYEVNDVQASTGDGRNGGQFDDIAGVAEITLQISIVW